LLRGTRQRSRGAHPSITESTQSRSSAGACAQSRTDCPFTGGKDIATALYYTGIDPSTKEEVFVAKGLRDRKMQRALMQFFKPEDWFTVREALI
jgi:hypothetical protein